MNEEIILVPPRISDDVEVDRNLLGDVLLGETIRKKGSKWCLFSKKSNKNLGCYDTKAGAEKREKQVQFFKHQSGLDRAIDALIEGTFSVPDTLLFAEVDAPVSEKREGLNRFLEFGPIPGISVMDTFRFYNRASEAEVAEAERATWDGDFEKARAIFKRVLEGV